MITREDWERAGPHLQAALDHAGNLYTLGDVAERIAEGQVKLMLTGKSAAALEFWDFPRTGRRALNVWLGGGDLGDMIGPGMDDIHDIARSEGCTDILVAGRRGWERALAPRGFEPAWQVLRKRL